MLCKSWKIAIYPSKIIVYILASSSRQLIISRLLYSLLQKRQLLTQCLTRVSKYTFATRMKEKAPILRKKVKDASHFELGQFLANIKEKCGEIGEAAMRQVMRSQNEKLVELSDNLMTVDKSASDLADFSPLYRCLHMFQVLGCRSECEQFFREERTKQVALVLQPVATMNNLLSYSDYFYRVAGFFLIEDTILNTTEDLITREWANGLWERAVVMISGVLEKHLANCLTSDTICSVKQLIAVFNQCLQSYGYPVGRLVDILLQVRQRYTTVLQENLQERLSKMLMEDNLQQVVVADEDSYLATVAKFPFESQVFREAGFPKTFPFSGVVPNIYVEIEKFIDASVKFVSDLDLSHTVSFSARLLVLPPSVVSVCVFFFL